MLRQVFLKTCKNDKLLWHGSYIKDYLGIGREMDCIQKPGPSAGDIEMES
jgi:hypothetical protein